MRLIITDSGLGGLSICAGLMRYLKNNPSDRQFDIKYINAVPATHDGYNTMNSREEKISIFDQFLHSVSKRYQPDKIYIACNSLSVIVNETSFYNENRYPVDGIVSTGIDQILINRSNNHETGTIILATETTINEGTYERLLLAAGMDRSMIASQSCPNLANTISNNPEGDRVKKLIEKYLIQAFRKFDQSHSSYLVYLGCTHYGYRTDIFIQVLEELNLSYKIINPNQYAIQKLVDMPSESVSTSEPKVEFISQYQVPENEIKTLNNFLSPISEETASALLNQIVIPDLF